MFPHVPRSGRVFASRTSHAGTPHQAKRGAKVTSVFPAFFAPFRIQPRCGQSFALVCMPPCPPEQGQSKTVSGSKKFGKLAPQQRFCALKHPFSASHFHRNGHRGPGSRSNGSCIIPLLSPSAGLEPAISLSLSLGPSRLCAHSDPPERDSNPRLQHKTGRFQKTPYPDSNPRLPTERGSVCPLGHVRAPLSHDTWSISGLLNTIRVRPAH